MKASQFVLNHYSPSILLNFYGQASCQPGHAYGPAVRDHYLFVYVKQGKGIFRTNGTTYQLKEDDCFLMFPQHLGFYKADQEQPWEYMWIGFNVNLTAQYLQFAGLTPEDPVATIKSKEGVHALFQQLFDLQGSPQYTEFFGTGIIYQVFAHIMKETAIRSPISGNSSSSTNIYIQKAIQFISDNYAESISVSLIASQLGLERSYFTKMFKAHAGISPHAYLMKVRMDKAIELLASTNLPIEHIAYSIGFNNINYFSAAFTRVFKMPPSLYRKKQI